LLNKKIIIFLNASFCTWPWITSASLRSSLPYLVTVRFAYHLAMQQKNIMRGSPKSSQSCDLHKGWLSLWMLRSLADPIVPKLGHTPSLPAVGQKLMKIWMKFHRAYSVPKLDKNLGSTTKVRKKVKIYFWRLIDDGLMLCTQLKRQRLKDGVSCLLCDKESLVHSFWSFSHSTLTWNLMSAEVGVSFEKPPNPLICHSELRGCLLDWI
jgi:hypothetical protein